MIWRKILKRHALLIAGLSLMVGACTSPTPTPLPPVQQTAIPATAATTARANATGTATLALSPTPSPKDVFLASFNNALSKIKTYRVRVPEEGRLIEVVLPDRFHQLETDDVVMIGPTYWQNTFGDKKPQTPGRVPFLDRVNLLWLRDQFANANQMKFLGPSVIDGIQTIGYSTEFDVIRVIPPRTPGPTPQIISMPPQIVKIWFNTTDGLPRRVEYGLPTTATVNFYDFNAKIEVNPP